MLGLAGSLLGSAASGVLGLFGQSSANQQASNLSEKQMRFQEKMSNTAFQRSSADMQAAGLNPAAMYSGSGGPASTPPGSMAPVGNTMAAASASLKDAASSATQTMVANKTIENLTSQIAKQNAEKANIAATLPSIEAKSGRDAMEFGDIQKIPPSVRIPIVQSGYGADKLASAGRIPAIGAGALASAKSAGAGARDGVSSLGGLSGPSLSSARQLVSAFKEKSPALGSALKSWWEREFPYIEPKYRTGKGSTFYKQ